MLLGFMFQSFFIFQLNSKYCHFNIWRTHIGYLCLCEPQGRGELGSLRQRQVLRVLKAPLQSRQLETGVNCARFADFLRFSIDHSYFWLDSFFFCKKYERKGKEHE